MSHLKILGQTLMRNWCIAEFTEKNREWETILLNFTFFAGFFIYNSDPARSKKIEKDIGIGGLKKIEHFYLSQPITSHLQNSIFYYLHTYPEWPGISIFSYPSFYPPTEVVSIFFYPPTEVVSIFFYPLVYLFHIN